MNSLRHSIKRLVAVLDSTTEHFKTADVAFQRFAGHVRGIRWQQYVAAEMPYGETVEGFDQWCAEVPMFEGDETFSAVLAVLGGR